MTTENQTDNADPSVETGRNKNGTFAIGNNAAKGRTTANWQPYGLRAQKWLDYTLNDLKALLENGDALGNMTLRDSMLVKHIINTMEGDDIRRERRDLLDRIEGTPVQTIRTGSIEPLDPNAIDAVSDADAARAYENLMKS